MRKIFGIVAVVGSICGSASAQADLTYAIASLEGYSRTEVVRLLLTSQYDSELLLLSNEASIDNYNKSKTNEPITTPGSAKQVDDKNFYPEMVKTKEAGKEYTEIQVINLNGMLMSNVVMGSVTNTLEKETRYIEITPEDAASPMVMSVLPAIELSAIDNKNTFTYSTVKNFTIGTSKGKYFVIADDNTYRYYDSNKLGGNQKLVEELKKGKPITAQTFFYEAQENGLINPDMTLKEFMTLSVEEHRNLMVIDGE